MKNVFYTFDFQSVFSCPSNCLINAEGVIEVTDLKIIENLFCEEKPASSAKVAILYFL